MPLLPRSTRVFPEAVIDRRRRNSAAEAALRCWRCGSQVAISYRQARFNEEKVKNHILPDLLAQIEFGNIQFFPETVPVEITPHHVVLERMDGSRVSHATDFVLMSTGFHQILSFLRWSG